MIYSRPQRQLVTEESIADRIIKEVPEDFLRAIAHDQGHMVRSMIGRMIRNEYGLWEKDHPLTQHWHLYPEAREIIDGVDFSEDHPDQVSARIIEHVRTKLEGRFAP